jgi:catechol 2,3-dioxygenase-like lactoylglutathione lyase family enzyme
MLVLCCLTAGCRSSTSNAPRAAELLVATPGAFVALSVADLDPMVAWYRDTLGFRVLKAGTAPNKPIRFALLEQGSALVELLQLSDSRPFAAAAPGVAQSHLVHGFFKSGFVVADIDRVYQQLRARGVTLAYELGHPSGRPIAPSA